ncbi:MAG TPA: hypothetical protein VFS15_01235 [Kofleriaceae bacterium]|nr:hypothetical protein [Kofleriaceae bacterium]
MRRLLLALTLCCSIGCGKDPAGGGGGDDDQMADAPMLSGDEYSLTWGPVSVPPGQENTQCIWMKLGNTSEIKVHQLHNVLNDASHHLIVYKDDMDTTEQLTPVNCQPFTGALNTTGMIAPIAITQKKDDMIFLPDRVAYTFAPNQMVKIEMHYINSTDETQDVEASVHFYAADPSAIDHEAAILFTGSPDINLGPGESTLHQFFSVPSYLDLSESNIFAITGHTHKLGTNVSVRVAPSKSGPMTDVYTPNPFKWDEPETKTFSTPFSIPTGGGLDFECTWNNTTSGNVGFGESANDEMCFFWAYYYPSQGSKVCFHTEQYGGANGLNLCCPGDSLCSVIEQNF